MTLIEGQIQQRLALITYWKLLIETGLCKQRKIFRGLNGPELTDEEKVSDAMDTLKRHIDLLGDLIEHLPPATQKLEG